MLSIFKILMKQNYEEERYKMSFFIKMCIVISLLLFINNRFNLEINIYQIDKLKKVFNINSYPQYIFFSVLFANLLLGIIKNFPMNEFIPFLNLPIKRNLFLSFLISKLYFDFSFAILLLLNLCLISFMNNLSSIGLTIWIFKAIFYSLLFQQIGFLIRILKISFYVKIVILLIFVSISFFIFKECLNQESCFFIFTKKHLFFFGFTFYPGILYITMKKINQNLIDYL
jgi:hypothetical protein